MEKNLRLAVFGHKRWSREGGIEIVVKELCTRMARMGCQVTCYNRSGHHVSGAEYDNTDQREYQGICQKYVPTIEQKGLAAVSSSFFAALFCALGKYDVVHIHAEGPAFFAWLPKLFGKRVMICCSEFMKTKMDSNPLFATKTVAMHNFIDKVEWKETEKKDYVLYFGRFSEEKGIGTLIKVCKELPDVQFIFAGTGPLEETVNGIKNIKNVGFQKGEALEKLIREARFSIYPSEWYENCPFSVMESQMYGTPVLGADIGGIPELIQVGKTGELFESGNGKDLKRKIEKLWGDKKLCEAYSKNCKDISFDTSDEYYEKIMKVYGGEIK
ncbi:MAG: glycosyltransferase family 4 protein [Blautia glucerasea]|nr:glycosyltransferase family 4 protein [Blautia glucerasea]